MKTRVALMLIILLFVAPQVFAYQNNVLSELTAYENNAAPPGIGRRKSAGIPHYAIAADAGSIDRIKGDAAAMTS